MKKRLIECKGDLLSIVLRGCGKSFEFSDEDVKETVACGVYIHFVECPFCGYATVIPEKTE